MIFWQPFSRSLRFYEQLKFTTMKKTFTICLLSIFCLAATSCSKDVKTPAKASMAATTTTNTSSQSGDQNGSGHNGCGNGHSDNNGGGY